MTTVQLMVPTELKPVGLLTLERVGLAMVGVAALVFVIGATGTFASAPLTYFLATLVLGTVGGLLAVVPSFRDGHAGIKHNGIMFSGMMRRGGAAWIAGIAFTAFYIVLYWYPEALRYMIGASEPLSQWLRHKAADRWFLYGTLYTIGVLVMGVRMMAKYRHSRYHLVRTASVMFFQLGFAFVLPSILVALNTKEFYFHYFWPLKPEYLFPGTLDKLVASGDGLLVFMGFWTVAMTVVATPVLTYFYGKRWYCSWVCGCGALAETVGDPWRQNSDKSLTAWKVERWMVYSVLLFITIVTILIWLNASQGGALLGAWSSNVNSVYGFFIGSLFSGVIGVGFYPIMGSRVWCRFGCPMAATLGILQKWFSRFRITTNGGQCISCGNCSTYCEMGIDVRAYAQRGEDIKRASCVGCGVCASVCPRGVLKLENK